MSPAQKLQRILDTIRAWERGAQGSIFSGHSLAQFKAAVQPSIDAHAKVADLRKQLRSALIERNLADKRSMKLNYRVGCAVGGDPAHGDDSVLYEEFGRTREAVRRSKIAAGRRRKR
jgi:hypothetical protein